MEERSSWHKSVRDAKLARALLAIKWSSPSNRVAKSLRNKTQGLAQGLKLPTPLIQGSAMLLVLCHPPPRNEEAAAYPRAFAMCAGPRSDFFFFSFLLTLFGSGRAEGNEKGSRKS